jgi:hypothetical protein
MLFHTRGIERVFAQMGKSGPLGHACLLELFF